MIRPSRWTSPARAGRLRDRHDRDVGRTLRVHYSEFPHLAASVDWAFLCVLVKFGQRPQYIQ